MIWFSADWHLGHAGILKHQPEREFADLEEMDVCLIDSINRVVQPNDELYFLGDFCWQASKAGHYRQRINVRKMYVCRGNHDAASLGKHVSMMEHMFFKKFNEIKIHLCHYPLLSWGSMHRGGYHLYAHCHGTFEDQLNNLFPGRRAMDVGIDYIHKLIGEWRPISLDEILVKIRKIKCTLFKPEIP